MTIEQARKDYDTALIIHIELCEATKLAKVVLSDAWAIYKPIAREMKSSYKITYHGWRIDFVLPACQWFKSTSEGSRDREEARRLRRERYVLLEICFKQLDEMMQNLIIPLIIPVKQAKLALRIALRAEEEAFETVCMAKERLDSFP